MCPHTSEGLLMNYLLHEPLLLHINVSAQGMVSGTTLQYNHSDDKASVLIHTYLQSKYGTVVYKQTLEH